MNEKFKKGLALVLALVMVFATTASVFAETERNTTGKTVTVEFYDGDELLMSWPVTIDESTITESQLNSLYTIPALKTNQYYNEYLLMNNQRPSAMDATLMALTDMDALGESEVGWDYYLHKDTGKTELRGGYLSNIFGSTTETDYSQTTGSLWVGNAWLYQITDGNGVEVPNLYATNVPVTDGMKITWTYTYGIKEPIN